MSKEPKWTPGPWVARRDEVLSESGRVAECVGPNVDANSHLMAAAPELYEALEDAFGYLCSDLSTHTECLICGAMGSEPCEPICTFTVARAALAKARGEADDETP